METNLNKENGSSGECNVRFLFRSGVGLSLGERRVQRRPLRTVGPNDGKRQRHPPEAACLPKVLPGTAGLPLQLQTRRETIDGHHLTGGMDLLQDAEECRPFRNSGNLELKKRPGIVSRISMFLFSLMTRSLSSWFRPSCCCRWSRRRWSTRSTTSSAAAKSTGKLCSSSSPSSTFATRSARNCSKVNDPLHITVAVFSLQSHKCVVNAQS